MSVVGDFSGIIWSGVERKAEKRMLCTTPTRSSNPQNA